VKIEIERTVLLDAMKSIMTVVPSGQAVGIRRHVLLEAGSGPEEYRNSRTNDHEVEFTVVVLAKNTNQTVRGAVLAVQYIVEVVVDMLWSIATGREGATLFDAANITQCVLSGVRYGVDEDANRGRAEDLRRYVAQRTDRAPSSADRILRGLRDEGVIGYTVEDRASSLYSVQAVDEDATPEQRKARALNASAARDCLRLAGKLRALGMEGEARKAEEWAKYLEPPPVVVEDCGQVGMFA